MAMNREQKRAMQRAGQVDDEGTPVSCSDVQSLSPTSYRWPARGAVSSEYGPRWGRMHKGIDVAAPTGEPVVAVEAATVVYAGWVSGFGNTVVLAHGGGIMSLYGHLDQVLAADGSRLDRGVQIGTVGSTGASTGPHLHLEIWRDGAPVDPRQFLGSTSPAPVT